MEEATMVESMYQSAKFYVCSSMYSMNHQASRRYSQGRNFGVERQQDFAVDIVPRRSSGPYDSRVRKGPYKGSRNLVWTSNEFKASEGNRLRKNDSYGSTKSPVSGTGYRVPNQPRKNVLYGLRNSSVPSSRVWRSDSGSPKSKECVCKYWKAGNCKKGEQCQFLHSWCCFPGLVMVATLEGHKKDIKGIALPQGSDKLYSASGDGSLRIWDCHSGQCVHDEIDLQAEAGSLISEGPWVFLGLPNAVKAFNVQTCKDLHLDGPVGGQVNAVIVGNGMLFAGTSSGSISVWKATDTESEPFKCLTSLEGHSGEVTCFIVGGQRLYSGSVDKTIKVWDLNTVQCIMTLREHSDTITSLLCWDEYLLSCSLDKTIKVWGSSENGDLKVIHTCREEQSVHALCGLNDAEAEPIIFCSYYNGTVGIFDLPSFKERGKMFSTHTISTLTIGPEGLLFSGDKSGKLRVWNLGGSKA